MKEWKSWIWVKFFMLSSKPAWVVLINCWARKHLHGKRCARLGRVKEERWPCRWRHAVDKAVAADIGQGCLRTKTQNWPRDQEQGHRVSRGNGSGDCLNQGRLDGAWRAAVHATCILHTWVFLRKLRNVKLRMCIDPRHVRRIKIKNQLNKSTKAGQFMV